MSELTSAGFINLALFTKKRRQCQKNTLISIQGDIDDIIEGKENVPYEIAFGVFGDGSLVLVEGRPGILETGLQRRTYLHLNVLQL